MKLIPHYSQQFLQKKSTPSTRYKYIGVFLFLSALFWKGTVYEAFAQVTAGPDTTISACKPTCVTLKAQVVFKDTIRLATSYKMDQTIPFTTDSFGGSSKTAYVFRSVEGSYPIGFTFNFFGKCYDKFYAGPGWIGFSPNPGKWGNHKPVPIPSIGDSVPKNVIMISWCDQEGQLKYQVHGTAPYRRLVISWVNALGPSAFSTFCQYTDTDGTTVRGHMLCMFSAQIILYETTNVIENHIYRKMAPTSGITVNAVEGLHNEDGTQAVVVPGRNSTMWPTGLPGIYKDAVRFTPSGPIATYKFAWYKDSTLIDTVKQISVCPTTTTTYTAKVIYPCPPDTFSDNATITVAGNSFSVNAGPDTTICLGKSIQLQAKGGVTCTWIPPTGLSNPNIPNPVAKPLVTTTYIVSATDTVCPGTATDTIIITVDSVNAVIKGNTSICKGDSTILIASGGTKYVWNPASVGTKDTVSVKPIASTTYLVTVTDKYSCSDTASIGITVKPLPTPTFTATSPVCAGKNSSITYTGNASGSAIYNWSFDAGNANPGNGKGPHQVNWANNGTKNISLKVTDNGCMDSSKTMVTVNQNFKMAIAGNTSICKGDSTVLTASGATAYLWNTGVTTTSVTVKPTITTSYTVTASNSSCSDTASITVTVKSIPTPTFTVISPVCEGQNSTITYTGNASGNATYSWGFDGGDTSGNGKGPYQVNWTSTGTKNISLKVTDNGCSDSSKKTVNVNANLILTITGNQKICKGDSTVLTATGATSYLWSTNATTSAITVKPTKDSTFTVFGSDSFCSGKDSVKIIVNEPPQANVGNDVAICAGTPVALNTNGNASYTYSWTPSTGLDNPNSMNPTANPDTTTQYIVRVTDVNNCSDTDTIVVVVHPIPTVEAGNDVTITTGETTSLKANTSSAGIFIWTPSSGLSCTSCQSTDANPRLTTRYFVTLTDTNNCTTKDSVVVYKTCGELFIPNAFTPNGDVENETFGVYQSDFTKINMYIFDRWGEKIYETDDLNKPWDGKKDGENAQQDVYVYVIYAWDCLEQKHKYIGHVTLIR